VGESGRYIIRIPKEKDMLKTTLAKIEEKVQHVNAISEDNRHELLQLLSTLKEEVEELSETQREDAESITQFTQISTHEATRQEKNPQLLQLSIEGLQSSVSGFESSHPRLSETVNSICHILSNMGI
jgi:ABC-type transporter Mla subunit MlaD